MGTMSWSTRGSRSGPAWRRPNRPGLKFIGAPYRALASFRDYILFKGSLENVIAEGRFDRNWRLPPGDAAKIKATGAVEIR